MAVFTDRFRLTSGGENDVLDITHRVNESVKKSMLKDGIAIVFVPGSTGAVTTIEFEPGLTKDFPAALERISPKAIVYEHQRAWNDDNGQSHVKAALVGPSLTVPFTDGRLTLGTWQQIVFLELDVRPRQREIVVQLLGE